MPYKDPQTQREYFRRYHLQNRLKKCAASKAWREQHPVDPRAQRARSADDYQLHKEKRRNKHRQWHNLNTERHKELQRQWRQRPESQAKDRARRERNRDRLNYLARLRYHNNRDRLVQQKVKHQKHRAQRVKANGGHFTKEQWQALCAFYRYTCLCCLAAEPEIKLTADHIVPLARGGSNDISNIQPLCLRCNRRKWVSVIDYR